MLRRCCIDFITLYACGHIADILMSTDEADQYDCKCLCNVCNIAYGETKYWYLSSLNSSNVGYYGSLEFRDKIHFHIIVINNDVRTPFMYLNIPTWYHIAMVVLHCIKTCELFSYLISPLSKVLSHHMTNSVLNW